MCSFSKRRPGREINGDAPAILDRQLVLDYGYVNMVQVGSTDERLLIPKGGEVGSLKDRVHVRKGVGIAIPLRSYFRPIRLVVSGRPEAEVPNSERFYERDAWHGHLKFAQDEIMFYTGVPHENIPIMSLPAGPGRYDVWISWSYAAADGQDREAPELLSIRLPRS